MLEIVLLDDWFWICVSIQIISMKKRLGNYAIRYTWLLVHYFSLIENINKDFIIIIKWIQELVNSNLINNFLESNVSQEITYNLFIYSTFLRGSILKAKHKLICKLLESIFLYVIILVKRKILRFIFIYISKRRKSNEIFPPLLHPKKLFRSHGKRHCWSPRLKE